MTPTIDVLIPTFERAPALAVTLTSLFGQTFRAFRVVVSDQSAEPTANAAVVRAAVRALRVHGHEVEVLRNLPRRGMAQQRDFLLARARAPYCLFLDDDVILEPWTLELMARAIRELGCGFVGNAVIGLSYADDVRPHEQTIELWDEAPRPERIVVGSPEWERYRVHNAANLWHVQRQLDLAPGRYRAYKVAWTGGCVLYDTAALREVGGFGFHAELPAEHAGEDVLAQLRVMARAGGCGIMPSGAYHQELPTTIAQRDVDAPRALRV